MKQYDITPKSMLQRLVSTIKSKLALIAFSGKLSDADNNMQYKPVIEVTKAEYDAMTDEERQGKLFLVDDGSYTQAKVNVTMDALAEHGVLSGEKRYIQGKDSVVRPYLSGYDTGYIDSLTEIHVDHLYADVGGDWVEIGEQILTLVNGVLGKNYYVQCDKQGILSITDVRDDSDESTCIGGFHYGRIRLSRTPSDVTVGIVPNSVWTLRWCPACNSPDAMVYIGNKLWGDIYLTRVKTAATDADGVGVAVYESSAYGSLPGTGSENFCQFTFSECLAKVGKRLSYSEEFVAAADGSPIGLDNSNENAWSATTNKARTTCGAVANAISFLNIVDLVGNVWKWNADKYELNRDGNQLAYSWHEVSDVKGDVHGPGNYGLGALRSGGDWANGSRNGSRCVAVNTWPWYVATGVGAWAVSAAR